MNQKIKFSIMVAIGAVANFSPVNADTVYMCNPCPAGYSCSKGVKTLCTAGKYSPGGSTTCSNCSAGTYSNAGASSCAQCGVGKYSPAGSSTCYSCSAGQYQDVAGQSSCKSCPAGKYSSSAGATSCSTCGAGTYSSGGASGCTSCANGTYSSAGASSCTTCPSGTYSNSARSACVNKCTASAVSYTRSVLIHEGKCSTRSSGPGCDCPSTAKCYVDKATLSIAAGQKAGTSVSVSYWLYSGTMEANGSVDMNNSCSFSCKATGNYKLCTKVQFVYNSSSNNFSVKCIEGDVNGTILTTVAAKDC